MSYDASVRIRQRYALLFGLPWTAHSRSFSGAKNSGTIACTLGTVATLHGRQVCLLLRRPRGRSLESQQFIAELERLEKLYAFSREVAAFQDIETIAGSDEAGAGCLAGPVVAGAVILPRYPLFEGLDDSKRLSSSRRAEIFRSLLKCTDVCIGVGIVNAATVDEINVRQARILAMSTAVENLCGVAQPSFLILDGTDTLNSISMPPTSQRAVVEGDRFCAAVAAASIVAKETRDRLMREAHAVYPQYRFDEHKGYGTKKHIEALMRHGPCPLHRTSYKPVAQAAALHDFPRSSPLGS